MTTNYNRQQAIIAKQIRWEGRFFLLLGICTIVLLVITGCGGSSQDDEKDVMKEAQERCAELVNGPCVVTDPVAFLATWGPPIGK